MHPTQIAELIDIANFYTSLHTRKGQALMNALSRLDLDLYRKISQNPLVDCFYNDDRIPAFISYLYIDSIVFDVADQYSFSVSFNQEDRRFEIKDKSVLIWSSDEDTKTFFVRLRTFFNME